MPPDTEGFKYRIWKIIVSTPFEYFIMLLIVCNTLLLMMKVSKRSKHELYMHIYLFVCYAKISF